MNLDIRGRSGTQACQGGDGVDAIAPGKLPLPLFLWSLNLY